MIMNVTCSYNIAPLLTTPHLTPLTPIEHSREDRIILGLPKHPA